MHRILKNNLSMLKYIKRFCPYHILLIIVSSLLGTLANLVGIFFIKFIIDSLTNNIELSIILSKIIFIFLLNLSISLIHIYIDQYAIPQNVLKIGKGMKNVIFDKCIDIDYECYENPEFYNKFTIAIQQADSRALSVLSTFSEFISSIFGITSFSIVISLYDPFLFILVFLNVVINFVFITLNSKLQHESYEEKILDTRKAGYAQRVFYLNNFAKEMRLFSDISFVIKTQFNNAIDSLITITRKYAKKLSLRSLAQTIISNSIHIINTIYLVFKVLKGLINISDFVTLSSSTSQLEGQLNILLQVFPNLYEHSLYIENFNEFINYTSHQDIYLGVCELKEFENMSIDNLFFSYPNVEENCLKNINIKIKKGDRIGFVGENGSGKTSLIKLITQLYTPKRGSIKINDINIELYTDESLKKNFAVLFQDYQIFSISIIENILMRSIRNHVEDENLAIEALKKVGLYEKVMTLPKGIYTNISYEYDENGAYLSGGELQRLAISRLYAKNSDIIILDEPTSSLDPLSENELFSNILNNWNDKTIILITHRLVNIRNCDKIFYFHDGILKEHGNHDELMKLNKGYAKMYRSQNKAS